MRRKPAVAAASRGRPRCFDRDHALDSALHVFWRKGYSGASLRDLTKAMGINRPSMYAAFGDKENLFRLTLDRYTSKYTGYFEDALRQPTARAFARRLLLGAADSMCEKQNPSGCLLVQGALASGDDGEGVRRELSSRRQASEAIVRRRLKRAKVERDLPAGADPVALARFLTTVTQGMAVQAASGANRTELRKIAETALQAWPK